MTGVWWLWRLPLLVAILFQISRPSGPLGTERRSVSEIEASAQQMSRKNCWNDRQMRRDRRSRNETVDVVEIPTSVDI